MSAWIVRIPDMARIGTRRRRVRPRPGQLSVPRGPTPQASEQIDDDKAGLSFFLF